MKKRYNVAIMGSGHIARDLYRKIEKDKLMRLYLVASRNLMSEGCIEARNYSAHVSDRGIDALIETAKEIDIVFDCTSAKAHKENHEKIKEKGLKVVDLTPSGIGKGIVPAVNIEDANKYDNLNLISCGGQSSIPIIYDICEYLRENGADPVYVEISSSISSKSAGMATRYNIDNYIEQTARAIKRFCGAQSKVILNINPGDPPVRMETSISVISEGSETIPNIRDAVNRPLQYIRSYLPGYDLLVEPKYLEANRIFCSISVQGQGDYLPEYAGNLDIITAAAVKVAQSILQAR